MHAPQRQGTVAPVAIAAFKALRHPQLVHRGIGIGVSIAWVPAEAGETRWREVPLLAWHETALLAPRSPNDPLEMVRYPARASHLLLQELGLGSRKTVVTAGGGGVA